MEQISFSPICEEFGKEIDRLTDLKNFEALNEYLVQVEKFSSAHSSTEYAPIFYYLGTGKGVLADLLRKKGGSDPEVAELRKWSLYYMRKALDSIESLENHHSLLLSLYTNYANALEASGRVIEALRIYRKAIGLNPRFGMAIGNYGRALSFYANLVNDSGHYKELHCYAYQAITQALENRDSNMHGSAIKAFEKMITNYDSVMEKGYLLEPIIFNKFDLGEQEEQAYRVWCLENHLFLNPLNDLITQENAFAHDPLTITQYTENVTRDGEDTERSGMPPKWFSMINQLKEEYIYARFLCYEGCAKTTELHYADKEVKLALSCDYTNYSIRIDQLKSAFKNLFAIFDQIAFFINQFWRLGLSEREADAAHVFRHKSFPTDNVALTALFWSHCEFCEKFGNAEVASERDLKILRNALEHKFVKVHDYFQGDKLQIENDCFYHISEDGLKKQVIRLLELAREWIMELVYAVGIEESKNVSEGIAIHLDVLDFDDNWKR